jgi:hypothetical protein
MFLVGNRVAAVAGVFVFGVGGVLRLGVYRQLGVQPLVIGVLKFFV